MKNLLARDLILWFGGWFRPETSQAALSDHDRLHKALAMLNCREPAAKSGVLLKVTTQVIKMPRRAGPKSSKLKVVLKLQSSVSRRQTAHYQLKSAYKWHCLLSEPTHAAG
jgi:hypothetical protein